eukprot:5323352-Pyramimonas_sp.AAC.1
MHVPLSPSCWVPPHLHEVVGDGGLWATYVSDTLRCWGAIELLDDLCPRAVDGVVELLVGGPRSEPGNNGFTWQLSCGI